MHFNIAANSSYENREGTITLSNGIIQQTVQITQRGAHIFLVSSQEYTIDADGGNVYVEVTATGTYKVLLPEVDWITETTTKQLTTNVHTFSVSTNESYDPRSTDIVFMDEETGETLPVKIQQSPTYAILAENIFYTIEADETLLNINVKANIEFTVSSNEDWIQPITTKALNSSTVQIKILENPNESERNGSIIMEGYDPDGNYNCTYIYITQRGASRGDGNIDDMPEHPWE